VPTEASATSSRCELVNEPDRAAASGAPYPPGALSIATIEIPLVSA